MQAALILMVAGFGADARDVYAWPLDLPRVLTSSFAEYRSGRYHMGIDLRTGPIGKDVYAAADGYVSRIRCSPYGYGKAVYLQLNDGNSVVYAHLDDFAPKLRDYVQRAQHDREKYTVDIYPDPGAFPVTRGEPIGKSGQTGIGVPHLHYEIRDRSGAPINPRLLGIDWPDVSAPVFRKAVVMPLDSHARINGDFLPVVLGVRNGGSGDSRADSVRISGPVAFGVDVVDPANGGGTRLGVHVLQTMAGPIEIFRLQHDRISYDHDQDGRVAYHPFLLDQGHFLMQWRWPGNESELFYHGESDGRFVPGSASVTVSIVSEDFHGNRVTLRIPIEADGGAIPESPTAKSTGEGSVAYDCFPDWLVVSVNFSLPESEAPSLYIDTGTRRSVPFERIDARTFRAAYDPAEGETEVGLTVVHPRVAHREERFLVVQRGAAERDYVQGDVEIHTQPHTPYGTLFLRVGTVETVRHEALRAVGPAYSLWHPDAPIDEPVALSFPMPTEAANPERVHVFRERKKGWELQRTRSEGGRLHIKTSTLGVFAVMEDSQPPTIRVIRPRPGQRFTTRRPSIRATIRDRGSAIDGFSATYNGRWILMEYDPEGEVLTWEEDEDLPLGKGLIRFQVSDGAGNVTVSEIETEIIGVAPN